MNQTEWTELKRIFAEACELGPDERSALLEKRCAGRPGLRAELEELLRQHDQLAARAPGSQAAHRDGGAATGLATGAQTQELVRRLKGHALEKRRYKLEGEIARGGMGAILRVWDEDLRRHLAMKVILGKASAASSDGTPAVDPQTLGRFLEEAQVTGQLDHPGIVPVHELGLDSDGRVYFTMKLVKGRDLREIFKLVHAGQEGWNETRALGVILKACEAMAYAHAKGVIHRDLKPANVMVGNFGEVYVMDWGIARVQGRKDSHDIRIAPEFTTDLVSIRTERREEREDLADSPLLTRDGDVMGTPAYMAPEQARGEIEQLGPCSDVYSMGAMLYHLLARQPPYLAPGARISNRTLLAQVLQGPPAPLAGLRADLPQELVAICDKAMTRETSQRYADTLELAEDLRAFLEHRVVGAYETGAWAEARKWVQRNRALAASLAAAVLLLVAGLTTSLVYKSRAEEQRELADGQRAAAVQSATLEKAARETAVAKEAEAQRELARSAFFIKLLLDMLGSADPHAAQHADLKVSEMLEQFETDLAARLVQEPEVRADAHLVLAHAWLGIGNSSRVDANLGQAQEALAENPDEGSFIRYLELQVRSFHAEQEWERAIEVEREVIARRTALGRPEDLLALPIQRAWLGDLLRHSGNLAEAESVFRELLSESQARAPGDEGAVDDLLADLSKVFIASGRFSEAEDVLRGQLDALSADALERPVIGVNLATAILRQGRIKEAEKLLRDLEPALRARYGDKHPANVGRLLDLGFACKSQGRLEEAEAAYRESLEIARATSTAGSGLLVGPLSELGTALFAQGRIEEALPFALEAYEIRRRKQPREQPDLARCAGNVSSALFSLSRFEEALPYCVTDVEIRRGQLPEDREELGLSLCVQAEVLCGLRRLPEAEAALRERMALYPSAEEDPVELRCTALMALGATLVGLERWKEAEPSLIEAIQMLESRAKPGYWALEHSRSLLGAALVGEGRKSEGEELLRSAAQRIKVPALHRAKKREALERLLHYLEASGQTADAAQARSELEALR